MFKKAFIINTSFVYLLNAYGINSLFLNSGDRLASTFSSIRSLTVSFDNKLPLLPEYIYLFHQYGHNNNSRRHVFEQGSGVGKNDGYLQSYPRADSLKQYSHRNTCSSNNWFASTNTRFFST